MNTSSVLNQGAKWYAMYTRSRYEKKLHTLLLQKQVECYLPLVRMLSQRSDRKKWIEVPLLPSYLFVKISEKQYFSALNTPGAVCLVSFDGQPVAIPEEQIDGLRKFLTYEPQKIEVHQGSFEEGDLVEVVAGPMKGVQGEVIELRGKQRLLLRFNALGYCVHVEVLMNELNVLQSVAVC